MIQKIQTLQKRLIAKTEEVVEKELLIQEKEKLYVELKHILARQPGPEVAEQLQIYQQTMKEKTKQMKVLKICHYFARKIVCDSTFTVFIEKIKHKKAGLEGLPESMSLIFIEYILQLIFSGYGIRVKYV